MSEQKKLYNVSVSLSTAQNAATFTLTNPIELNFLISNNDEAKTQKICRYMTPIEGFCGDILTVTNDAGEQIEYQGILKKRSKPTEKNYFSLEPCATLSHAFVLTDAYPITKKGTYTIQFNGSEHLNHLPDSEVLKIVVE